jgi:Type II secretory pathway, prepilin signal peptidase PulO and related peptidases
MENFLLIFWLGAVGATVGSFLNVVIYRLPRGESLVSPPSHCPKCDHKIRMYHNIPIFGWFFLGGRCRDCKQPISFRYPLIESISCIMVMAFSALLMPVEQVFVRPTVVTQEIIAIFEVPLVLGQIAILPMTFAQVIIRIIWLSVLHLFLLAIGMIDFDEQKLKIRGIFLFLLPFVIFAMFFGHIFPVSWFSVWPFEGLLASFSPQRVPDFLATPFFDMLFGVGSAILLGFLVTKIIRIDRVPLWLAATTAVGMFLGWQLAFAVVLLTLLLHVTIVFVTRRSCAILALCAATFFVNIWALTR